MGPTTPKARTSFGSALIGIVIAVAGYSIIGSGRGVVQQWSDIGAAYAACGVLWMVAGTAMIVGGIWVAGSLGRHRIPLWAGGLASILAGASLVIGVLTYVVPCSGPS